MRLERSDARGGASRGLFVLGMHRSGTSATAGALQRLGFFLGDQLVEGAPDNPKGYYEHAKAVDINDALLAALDRSWDDVRALPPDWLESNATRASEAAARSALGEFSGATLWAMKDPRLCRTFPLWRKIVGDENAACLLVLRHPDEVAASLRARDGMVDEHSALLWLRHVFEAIKGSRGLPRIAITYDALVEDPAARLAQACSELGFAHAGFDAAGLRAFVDAADRHHRCDGREGSNRTFVALAKDVYARAIAGGDVFEAIEAFEPAFSDLLRSHDVWVEVLGGTIRAGDVKRKSLREQRIDASARADGLQAAFDEVAALSLSRLEALHAQERQLRDTQEALAAAETLSLQRLDAIAEFDRRLGETQAALEAAEAMSIARLEALAEHDDRIRQLQTALASIEKLSIDRLESNNALETRIGELLAELDNRSARVDELERLGRESDERQRVLEEALAALRGARWTRMGMAMGLLHAEQE